MAIERLQENKTTPKQNIQARAHAKANGGTSFALSFGLDLMYTFPFLMFTTKPLFIQHCVSWVSTLSSINENIKVHMNRA